MQVGGGEAERSMLRVDRAGESVKSVEEEILRLLTLKSDIRISNGFAVNMSLIELTLKKETRLWSAFFLFSPVIRSLGQRA